MQLGTGGLDRLYNADKNNFGPRAGLAWDVTGDGLTSVRSSSFGQIGSAPDVDRGNPVIGFGGPRAMQWAVKVLF